MHPIFLGLSLDVFNLPICQMSNNVKDEQQGEVAHIDNDLEVVKSVDEVQEVTRFIDESSIRKVDYIPASRGPSDPYVTQDVINFLERPYVIGNVRWDKTQTFGTCIWRASFPECLLGKDAVWNKLQNYKYLRAGVQISIRVNATAFHYGKLLGVWRPLGLYTTKYAKTSQNCTGYDNIYTLSSYPHVMVSPLSSETAMFTANYNLPVDWIDLEVYSVVLDIPRRYQQNLGVFELWVLNPLCAMGVDTDPPAYLTIFGSFVNPEVSGYIAITRDTPRNFSLSLYANKLTADTFSISSPIVREGREEEQFDQSSSMDKSIKERGGKPSLETQRSGKLLPKAQSDANGNTGDVEAGVKKITWFPEQIASGQVDLPAIPLSLTQGITHKVTEANMDLMAFMSKPCFVRQTEITKSMGANTMVVTYPVSPLYCAAGSDVYGHKTRFNTRLSFVASCFEYWRGTIRFHFNVVCSKFHSLRLRFDWFPETIRYPRTDGLELASVVSKVVDVQGECDFFIDVPWLHTLPMLPVQAALDRVSPEGINGYLRVTLLNPIVYPDVNMPPVQLNMWMSAGPDLEFAKLRATKDVDYKCLPLGIVPTSVKPKGRQRSPEFLPRAQVEEPNQEVSSGPMQGSDSQRRIGQIVGEQFVSLNQIISKPCKRFTLPSGDVMKYVPPVLDTVNEAAVFLEPDSWMEYFRLCFVGDSGPVLLTVPYMKNGTMAAISTVSTEVVISLEASGFKDMNALIDKLSSGNLAVFEKDQVQRSVVLPYYCNLKYRPLDVLSQVPVDTKVNYPSVEVTYFGEATTDAIKVLIRAGENYGFHLPIGVPALSSRNN